MEHVLKNRAKIDGATTVKTAGGGVATDGRREGGAAEARSRKEGNEVVRREPYGAVGKKHSPWFTWVSPVGLAPM